MAEVRLGAWAWLLCLSVLVFQLAVVCLQGPFLWWRWLAWVALCRAGVEHELMLVWAVLLTRPITFL